MAGEGSFRPAWSVSELTARIKSCLEGEFRLLRVEGEVSNYRLYPSGHRYFSLKDDASQVRVVLFRGRERFILGEIRDGRSVIVTGSLGVYEKKGEYQIYAQSVEVRGIGSLLLELEKRKAALAAEGLFDPERKRPLPVFPRRIGIVTSRAGAALRDMIRIARKRWPPIGITLSPCLVQGEGAAEDISRALSALATRPGIDLIIVGRGGGSMEDLWAFNEEPVVRAIAASAVPTISAVGHETDFTLADLAADHRASTPSAAAQMAVPDRREWGDRVHALLQRAGKAERYLRETLRREHRVFAGRLADPRPLLEGRRFAATERADALAAAMDGILREHRERIQRGRMSVALHSPAAWVTRKRGELGLLAERSAAATRAKRAALGKTHGVLARTLAALDPKGVLTRGYAIATHGKTGRAVRSVSEVAPGDPVEVLVSDGSFGTVVDRGGG